MDTTQLNKAYYKSGDWCKVYYKGVQMLKYTTDLWQFREIFDKTKPDLIIETGSLDGGSALFFRDHSKADILTIDIKPVGYKRKDIIYLTGDSLAVPLNTDSYRRVMVVLDSDHNKEHVLAELKRFAPLVTKGCYLVAEDTFISDYLENEGYPNGSVRQALLEWDSTGFEVQSNRFALSMNPGGLFKRI